MMLSSQTVVRDGLPVLPVPVPVCKKDSIPLCIAELGGFVDLVSSSASVVYLCANVMRTRGPEKESHAVLRGLALMTPYLSQARPYDTVDYSTLMAHLRSSSRPQGWALIKVHCDSE